MQGLNFYSNPCHAVELENFRQFLLEEYFVKEMFGGTMLKAHILFKRRNYKVYSTYICVLLPILSPCKHAVDRI